MLVELTRPKGNAMQQQRLGELSSAKDCPQLKTAPKPLKDTRGCSPVQLPCRRRGWGAMIFFCGDMPYAAISQNGTDVPNTPQHSPALRLCCSWRTRQWAASAHVRSEFGRHGHDSHLVRPSL
jgi:hypothetical protein